MGDVMATLKYKDENGVWQYAPSLKYKDESGVFQTKGVLKYKDAEGIWHKVRICRTGSNSGSNDDDYPTISTLTVGSSVYLNENGSPAEYLVIHAGLPNSTLYDDSCDGVWLLRKDIYENKPWNSTTSNNYSTSSIHTHLNNVFLSMLDDNVKSVIKTVKVPYGVGGGTNTVESGSNGVSAQIFLLSANEVGLYDTSEYPTDGSCLSYFDGASNSLRVAKLNGIASYWWLRSPDVGNNSVWTIIGTGTTKYSYAATGTSYGVRPALILPHTAKLDPETNTIIG